MSATNWVRAPIGPEAAAWNTVPVRRTVLIVVHTVVSANRLADILPVFESDHRVQLVFTTPGSSAISEGVLAELAGAGALTIPWTQALSQEFDLALAVNHSGDLHLIRAPLALLSHGIGYTKYSPRIKNQESRIKNQESRIADRAVYGMARDWLVRDGAVFADALVLSHPRQVAQLVAGVPEAAPVAVVAGDPCLDRLRASRSLRHRYRARLGVGAGTTVVTVTSTWGSRSLLGGWPELPRELLARLDCDRHRVLLVLHPHVWYAHGPHQVRAWFAAAVRAGLTLVPPSAGWQQALLAADVVIGDNGAVTGYAAAIGTPTLLAAFDSAEIVPGTAIDALGRCARRLDPRQPLPHQVSTAIEAYRPGDYAEVAELTSSLPDRAATHLRTLCYRLLRLAEPALDPPVCPLPVDALPIPPTPDAFLVEGVVADGAGWLRHYPADAGFGFPQGFPDVDGHLTVHGLHPVRALRAAAAVLYLDVDEVPSAPETWLAETVREWACCRLAVVVESATSCLVHNGQSTLRLSTGDSAGPPPHTFASMLYRWLAAGGDLAAAPDEFRLTVGAREAVVRLSPAR